MKIEDKLELIKGKISRNRIVMPAMDTLMAEDGHATAFHIQHYGSRAYGGVGTIVIESTAVSSEGRICIKDLGIWKDSHIKPLSKVIKISKIAGAIIGIQLNHAGSKANLFGDVKKIYGATTKYNYIKYGNFNLVTPKDLLRIKNDFISAAIRAKKAGADFVEIHAAHGYFLSQLITPLLNEVTSGTMVERASILLDIIKGINNEVKIPIGVRFSLSDHSNDGLKPEDFEELIKKISPYISYVNGSSGATVNDDAGFSGDPLFRIPMAKIIKNFTNKPVITVGNFMTKKDVQRALEENIDAVAIGREIIYRPNLVINTLLNAKEINDKDYHWNNNIWFSPKRYSTLCEKLKNKK